MALSDTQIALLRHAAADPAGDVAIELPEGEAGRAARLSIEELLRLDYLRDVQEDGAQEGRIRHYRITAAGRQALGPGPADG